MQGCARLRMPRLGADQTWDVRESANLEGKVLREQGTDGLEIVLTRE